MIGGSSWRPHTGPGTPRPPHCASTTGSCPRCCRPGPAAPPDGPRRPSPSTPTFHHPAAPPHTTRRDTMSKARSLLATAAVATLALAACTPGSGGGGGTTDDDATAAARRDAVPDIPERKSGG